MKIYAVADIHARSHRLENIRAGIAELQPDCVIIAGDIISYFRPGPVFSALEALTVPVFVVRGNSDPAYLEKRLETFSNITSLHARKIVFKAIPLVGISGAVPVPFRSRIRFFEKGLFARIKPLVDQGTVLVVHPPPYGARDRVGGKVSAGSEGVRTLVEETRPAVVICGHIHEDAGIDRIGSTIVVNCCMTGKNRGALITLDPGSKSADDATTGRAPVVEML